MNGKLRSKEADLLIEGMMYLDTPEDYYNFFEDLLTVAELKSLAVRFAVAKLLFEGKTYNEVAALTGASTATISRISRSLGWGADGYHSVLRRMNKS